MNRTKWILCTWILRLDRIPRYGRLYEVKPPWDDDGNFTRGPAQWTWQRYGHWGLALLNRLGWTWQYVDEAERREHGATNQED